MLLHYKNVALSKMKFLLFLVLILTVSFGHAQDNNWLFGMGGNSAKNSQSLVVGPMEAELVWSGGVDADFGRHPLINGDVLLTARGEALGIPDDDTQIVAQDLETGDIIWQRELPIQFPSQEEWSSVIVGSNNNVVYGSRTGNELESYLYALDIANGDMIWQSEDIVKFSSSESVNYADNGDIIVGNKTNIRRVSVIDGTTQWEIPRDGPDGGGGLEVAIYGNKGYCWERDIQDLRINVIDLSTGVILYYSDPIDISPILIQQQGIYIAADGSIYAPRLLNETDSSLVSLTDSGSLLEVNWEVPMGYSAYASNAVNLEGHIYTYSLNNEIVKLNPTDGSILNTSIQIAPGNNASFSLMAIDADGKLYVTNGQASATLYCFDSDLDLIWSVNNIPSIYEGGPALGGDGYLAIAGAGENVRIYKTETLAVEDNVNTSFIMYPNPVQDILYVSTKELIRTLKIYTVKGSLVKEQFGMNEINLSGLTDGIYFIEVSTSEGKSVQKFIKGE